MCPRAAHLGTTAVLRCESAVCVAEYHSQISTLFDSDPFNYFAGAHYSAVSRGAPLAACRLININPFHLELSLRV